MDSGQNIPARRSDTILQTRREPLPWPDDRTFRILSLDGGGIKGIFPAAILAYLEENWLNGQPIGDYFDLIAGTSTGGIIALGLGAGLAARSLLDLYVNEGHRVFPPRQRQKSNRLIRRLSSNRYDRAALDELLWQILGVKTLRESRYRLLIPATEAKHGDPAVYKTPHHPRTIAKSGMELYKGRTSERWECVDMEAAESLFGCLEQVADPRRPRGVRHPFQAILRLTLLGLVCGQTTMAHIALFARMHWMTLKEPLGFVRDHPPHATTISRTLAGVSYEQLQGALTGWVAQVVSDREMSAAVDGKWAKQSEDAQGNPLVMVNVLAHDLRLCLAQWPASEKRYEPGVLREQLGWLFESYPGLQLLTMDALYAERDLCQAIVSHGRDYLVRIKGNRPEVLTALAGGFAGEELGEPEAETVEKKRA